MRRRRCGRNDDRASIALDSPSRLLSYAKARREAASGVLDPGAVSRTGILGWTARRSAN
jgi:hypothetical protein